MIRSIRENKKRKQWKGNFQIYRFPSTQKIFLPRKSKYVSLFQLFLASITATMFIEIILKNSCLYLQFTQLKLRLIIKMDINMLKQHNNRQISAICSNQIHWKSFKKHNSIAYLLHRRAIHRAPLTCGALKLSWGPREPPKEASTVADAGPRSNASSEAFGEPALLCKRHTMPRIQKS